MHSGDCWARTEIVRVSPGVGERRNVIIDNLPIVLTSRHSIEESSGQSRFHVFSLLLLLLFFFCRIPERSRFGKKKERGWRKFRLTTACDYHFRLEFFYESATVILRPWVLVRPRELNTAVKRSTDWATKHSIVFYRQTLMEEGLEIWLHWTHTGQKEVSQWPPDQAVPFPRFLEILLMKEWWECQLLD